MLTQQSLRLQPGWPFRARLQIKAQAAPGIGRQLLFGPQQPRPGRVQVDVIAHGLEIPITAAIHDQGFIATAEKMAKELMPTIEPPRVGPQIHNIAEYVFVNLIVAAVFNVSVDRRMNFHEFFDVRRQIVQSNAVNRGDANGAGDDVLQFLHLAVQ